MVKLKITKNSDKFRQPAIHYQKYEQYIFAPSGTSEYIKYWSTEFDRCKFGFTAKDGDYISGFYYFYLNYFPIDLVKEVEISVGKGLTSLRASSVRDFPSFYDYDRMFFESIEECDSQGKHLIVLKSRRKGYEQPNSEIVHTIEGPKTMGSLQIGDNILTPNGKSAKILEYYPQGKKDVYEVTLFDGRKVTCGKDHLWGVYTSFEINKNKEPRILNTNQLLEKDLKVKGVYKYFLKINKPVETINLKSLPIPPYTLGAILGDGNVSRQFKISGIDDEVFDKVLLELNEKYRNKEFNEEYLIGSTYKANKQLLFNTNRLSKWKTSKFSNRANPVYDELRKLNLATTSNHKYIPDIYKYHTTIYERIELVKGLMDTDGYISKDGAMTFSNVSKKLVEDFQEVLYSIGIGNTLRKRKDGLWIIYINTNKNLFHLSRKSKRVRKDRKGIRKYIPIINIQKLDYQEESSCILIDSKDHLYLTNKYIPTHNSYKIASMLIRNYYFYKESKGFALAAESEFLIKDGILTKAWDGMDFLDQHSAWYKKRQVKSTMLWRRASFLQKDDTGVDTELGYKSEIMGVTLKNDPQKARGKKGKLIIFEEAGKFRNLLQVWQIARPSVEQGAYVFGTMVAFGTGGTEGEDFDGLKELFERPKAYNCLEMNNIWDEDNLGQTCGFFVPQYANLEGIYKNKEDISDPFIGIPFMDEDGNTNTKVAKQYVLNERLKVIKNATDKRAIDRHVAEHPIIPAEALLDLGGNIFPKADLQRHLAYIRNNDKANQYKQVGDLYFDNEGKVKWMPVDPLKAKDITKYRLDPQDNPNGQIVIWEHPMQDAPWGLYIGGTDPYDFDKSGTNSLGSTFIFKRFQSFEKYYDLPVAEYTGRPDTALEYYENVRKLLVYYNATLLYENEKKGLFFYFERVNATYLLADQPNDLIGDIVKDSKVDRKKGIHMSQHIKDWGEGAIKDWLIEEYAPGKKNLTKIMSEPLLEELIAYNDKGNFDRCLIEGTEIHTKEGVKQIELIKVGDEVVTHTGKLQQVTAIGDRIPDEDLLHFKIVGSYEPLVVTEKHPILTAFVKTVKHNTRKKVLNNIGFLEATELNYKYQFALLPKRKYLKPSTYSADLMYLLGWYISDGYVNINTQHISFCLQHDQEVMAEKLATILDLYSNDVPKEYRNRKYIIKPAQIIKKKGYIKVNKTSEIISNFLIENGGSPNNKLLSSIIYNSSNTLMLLVGFLEGDGHQKNKANYDGYKREVIEVAGIYKNLMKQIRQLLIDNSIWSSMRYISNKNKKGKPQYSLSISRKYINKIAMPSLKFKTVDSKGSIPKNLQFETEDGFWTPIKLIKKTSDYTNKVYNFEVLGDNSYIAGDVAVHNCIAYMLVMMYRQQLHKIHVKSKRMENRKRLLFPDGLFTGYDEENYTYNISI